MPEKRPGPCSECRQPVAHLTPAIVGDVSDTRLVRSFFDEQPTRSQQQYESEERYACRRCWSCDRRSATLRRESLLGRLLVQWKRRISGA
jgi:hypothetical protein